MNPHKFLSVFALLMTPCVCSADLLVKSTGEIITGGRPGIKSHTVMKIKGPWQFSQVEMGPVKSPGSFQPMAMPKSPTTLVNCDTREIFVMKNGKWDKQSIPSASQMEMTEKAMGGNPMANAKFKPTGRNEKVSGYDSEVWESKSGNAVVTVWAAPALKNYKKTISMSSPGMTKESEEKMRKAWSVLPGYVVRSRIEIDMSKIIAASMPPGAKLPQGVANMKSVSTSTVEEIREVTFTDAEFPLPAGAK